MCLGCIWGVSGVYLGWKIYRTSIENLSKIYRTSIEHLSNIYVSEVYLGCIWVVSGVENLSKINRKSIDNLSKIYRTPIDYLSKIYVSEVYMRCIWGVSGVYLGRIGGCICFTATFWTKNVKILKIYVLYCYFLNQQSIEHLSKIYRKSMDTPISRNFDVIWKFWPFFKEVATESPYWGRT